MPAPIPALHPSVTVLMCVYNGARFLDESLDSIRNQTYTDYEFLIVDDGSTDATPEILARHAVEDSRIRILRQKNGGVISAINHGFTEAKGEFIARMDSDDVARPHRLAVQIEFLKSNPKIALVGGAIEVTDAAGRPVQIIRLPETPEQLRRQMLESGCSIANPTVLFRRQAFIDAGGLRPAYLHAEDYDLWLRMMEKHDLANLPEVLLSYRRHEGSVSIQWPRQQTLSSFCARITARKRLDGEPDPTFYVDLITPEVVLGLGVTRGDLDAEMVRGLYEAMDMGVDQGRRTCAAKFISLAKPYARPSRLREAALKLNRKAANVPATPEEQASHRRMLLDVDPGLYREIFGVVVRPAATARVWDSSAERSPARNGLSEILRQHRYDTDKSDEFLRHYDRAFAHLRNEAIAIMELGVNRGGSLYLWRDYFSRGTVVGIDLELPAGFADATGRCRLFQCDQGDPPSLYTVAADASPAGYDIIIDDASHMGALTASSFSTLFHNHLRPGGFYAIEDWGTGYWDSWPDGARPAQLYGPSFPRDGKHFPSHDCGMVGFVKQLLDECAMPDICHPRYGVARTRKSWIGSMNFIAGLLIIEKSWEEHWVPVVP